MKTLTIHAILVMWLTVGAVGVVRGEVISTSFDAPSLADNLIGEGVRRNALVYLPPGYETNIHQRYPVVYLLHSFGVTNRSWLGEAGYEGLSVPALLDSLIRSVAIRPMIVVMPDARNRLGGSWYTDSPTTGRWEEFIAVDLVRFIDRNYRTRVGPTNRGIVGQSMGGYGALRIAMHHPDVFGAVLGMSAPNILNPDPLGKSAHEAALSLKDSEINNVPILGRVIWSKAAAFSPNPSAPPLFADLPFERAPSGIVRRDAVWAKWVANTLVSRIGERVGGLRRLRIRLEVGNRDPLRGETLAFTNALAEQGIVFSLAVFDGGHVEGVRRQFEASVFAYFDRFFQESK